MDLLHGGHINNDGDDDSGGGDDGDDNSGSAGDDGNGTDHHHGDGHCKCGNGGDNGDGDGDDSDGGGDGGGDDKCEFALFLTWLPLPQVNLYSDPPQPSHSIHLGVVPQGTKVLSFTIPRPHSAEWWPSATQNPHASAATGRLSARGDLSPSSPPSMPTSGWLPDSQGTTIDQPSAEWTQALASQASQLLAKVKSFEGLMQAECLTPQDQLQSFQQLRATHAALEDNYLQAYRGQHLAPQHVGPKRMPGDADPCRELEAEINQLGIRLEELKDHMDRTQREPEPPGPNLPWDSGPAMSLPNQPACLPTIPAIQTLYPQPATTVPASPCMLNVEVSPHSSGTVSSPLDVPGPLRDKELQMEQDFHGLLDRYISAKSLPEALRMEEKEEEEEEAEEEEKEGENCHILEVDGPASAPGRAGAARVPPRQHPAQAERSHRAPLQEAMEPPAFQTSVTSDRYMPGRGKAEAAPSGPGILSNPPDPKSTASHQSSMTSLEGSSTLEHLPHKSPRCAGGPHVEEPWMASPETDSGFVGSETSRVSPLTQTPEHRLSHISTPGRSTQCFTASAPHEGASHPKARDLVVPKRAAEPSTPRSRAQRHLSTLSSPLRQGTPVSRLERTLAADMVVPSSELKGQKRISEKLLPGRTISPAPTPVPAAASLPHGPAESTPNLFVTRTGRDQAIRDLQAEVSRLRLRLEDSLHQPCQGSPICSTSAFDRSARSRDRPMDSSVTWGSHCGSKSTERLSREPEGAEPAVPRGRQRARSSSVPREVPQLSLSSESESLSPQLSSEKSRIPKDHPWAARDGTRGAGSGKRSDRVSFRGQYTGQEYHVLSPKAVQKDSNTASCPHCQPIRVQDSGNAAKDPLEPPATNALCCPLCGQVGSPAEGDGPGSVPSGTEKASPRRNAPPTSSPKQKSRRAGSPAQPPPGLWYLAAVPPAPAPPACAYISSVPVMPYPSATVYYVPPAPTSAPAASPRPAQRHRHSIQLNLDELDELQAALSQAARAAESVRSTTRQMRRSLAADLRQARDLRGSCLF
uniref:AT-hook-containing transcription factor n=1 Tax=Castor canadensis TaxID=51338 RepID=A0A8B7U8W9_CASCN|nr:AT-hook-containing transcription factor [Castor canadensis]